MQKEIKLRNFHEAKWDEPIVCELSVPGQRGILIPPAEKGIQNEIGDIEKVIPASLKRKKAPNLPEIAQPQVLRHYLRLSQETMGQEIVADIGLGTCTMKYSPKINEQFVRNSEFADLHPLQAVSYTHLFANWSLEYLRRRFDHRWWQNWGAFAETI